MSAKLALALKELLEVCYTADMHEELPECIDGSYLDQAKNTLTEYEESKQ